MATGAKGASFDEDERRIVHFTGFAHGATHYVELVYPTLAIVLARETGIPLERVLSWSFASYLLFGLGALPAGYAADRWGARRVILIGLWTAGAATCSAAVATPGWPLALSLAGVGLGASLYHPAGTGLLTRAVRARGRALGINGIYGNVGIALAPLATATLSERLGWRTTFAITGGVLLAATAVFSRVPLVEPPRAAQATASEAAGAPVSRRAVATFALLCFTAMLGGFAYRGNTVAQPALFAEEISVMGYGLAASLAMLAGIAGQYAGGLVADNRELEWSYLVFHLASLPLLVLVSTLQELPLLAASAIYAFFALGMQPIENTLFATLTPDRWRSTAYGLKFVLTFGVGSSAVWLVRAAAASWGWAGVYRALAVVVTVLVLGIGALIAMTRRGASRSA